VESAERQWLAPNDSSYLADKLRTMTVADLPYIAWFARNALRRRLGAAAPWGPRYEGIDRDMASLSLLEVVARQWSTCVTSAHVGLESIDSSRVLTIRYEELLSNAQTLSKLADFCEIDAADLVGRHSSSVRAGSGHRWKDWSEERRELLNELCEPAMRTAGYHP
jgi:hypothetical protein